MSLTYSNRDEESIFLPDDGEWSSWSDWFCGCDDNVRTRARTCEDSIPASGPQCEPYNSKMETEEQPGICVRTGRMEGRNKKQQGSQLALCRAEISRTSRFMPNLVRT